MSKSALADAFRAGFEQGYSAVGPERADEAFELWWQRSVDTLDRSSTETDSGWTDWDGSAKHPPVMVSDLVQIRFGSGKISERIGPASDWGWKWFRARPDAYDIVAYKVVKP